MDAQALRTELASYKAAIHNQRLSGGETFATVWEERNALKARVATLEAALRQIGKLTPDPVALTIAQQALAPR